MDDREKHFVDELIDASLRHYARAEPRPGLEGRILAGVRARRQSARRLTAWTWAMAVAGAAALTTLLIVHRSYHQTAPLPNAAKAPAYLTAPTVAKVAPPLKPPVPRRPPRHVPRSKIDTRPQQFPTPRPLSEQEKLLLVYAQSLKNSAAASAPDIEQDPEHDLRIAPLNIAAIKIEPLPQ